MPLHCPRLQFLISLLIGLSTSVHAHGQSDMRNAATWYHHAIEQYNQAFTIEQREVIANFLDSPNQPPSQQVRDLVSQAQSMLGRLRRGIAQEYSDNQLDYGQGLELLLPHLSPMRGIAKLMAADAMIHLQDGDATTAAVRMADMYRMAGHFGDDRVLLSSLVGQSVFTIADQTVQAALDRGAISPEDAAKMVGSLKWLGTEDPFNYVDSIASEQEIALASLEKVAGDPDGMSKLTTMLGEGENPELQMMDKASFEAAVQQYDQMMGRVSEVFAIKDPEKAQVAMKAWEADVAAGTFGPLAKILAPAFGKILERKLKATQMVSDRLDLLQKIAGGDATVFETANAAMYYLHGMEMMSRIDPAQLQAIRALAADPTSKMTDELAATLKHSVEVIDCFRLGAMIKRCDFTTVRPRDIDLPLSPDYVAGMHDGFRLAQAEVIRLLAAGDNSTAAALLATCLRICAHLGSDPLLTSSLVAHLDFNRTMALTRQAVENHAFGEGNLRLVANDLERVSRRDPFGYVGAVVESRKVLATRLTRTNPRDEEQRSRLVTAADVVKTWNADQILFYQVIADTLLRNASTTAADNQVKPLETGEKAATVPPADPLARLDDVLNRREIDVARGQTARIAPMLAQDNWDMFADLDPIPALALPKGILDRMEVARADIRRAMSLLKPLVSPDAVGAGDATTQPAAQDRENSRP